MVCLLVIEVMSKEEILKTVVDICVDQLGVNPEQVTLETSFIADLGADSLDTIELVMAMEEEFSVNIADEDAEKVTTVAQAVELIERYKDK